MSRYTRSKQGRTHGAYRERLQARGLAKAPTMPTLRTLRKQAGLPVGDLPAGTS